jgi:hypothetical protein
MTVQSLKPLGLTIRTVKTFNPVGATDGYQQPGGVRVTLYGDVGAESLAERPRQGMPIFGKACAGSCRRSQKLLALRVVTDVCRKVGMHVGPLWSASQSILVECWKPVGSH